MAIIAIVRSIPRGAKAVHGAEEPIIKATDILQSILKVVLEKNMAGITLKDITIEVILTKVTGIKADTMEIKNTDHIHMVKTLSHMY